MKSDVQQASAELRALLNQKNIKHYPGFLLEAYTLLGDIYIDIDQVDLAIKRYEKAWSYSDDSMDKVRQRLLLKKGTATLKSNPNLAISYFNSCLVQNPKGEYASACREGLADAQVALNKSSPALKLYLDLEQHYQDENHPEDLVRIQAKLANAYYAQNDIVNARTNFQNAYSNAQLSPPNNDVVLDVYNQAKENIISGETSLENQKAIRGQNIELNNLNPRQKAVEQLKLAELYVLADEPQLALSTLKEADKTIGNIDAPEIKAEINRKSSRVFARQGEFDKAFEALRIYEKERQAALDATETNLNKQLAIVKNQQRIDLDEKDYINAYNKTTYDKSLYKTQRYIIVLLSSLLLIAAISLYIIWRNIESKKRTNSLLQLKNLRAQMNPHFLFNALNTVNEYIITQDERSANQYLTDFSSLMRHILDNSQKDLIPLHDELHVSRLYLELEHRRFSDHFDFNIEVDDDLPDDLQLPPLTLQPFLENAIWHGLRYKKEKGTLFFNIKNSNTGVVIRIIDNGIGRLKSKELKTQNQKLRKSTGLSNTTKRIQLVNRLYNTNMHLYIMDAFPSSEDVGTEIKIELR